MLKVKERLVIPLGKVKDNWLTCSKSNTNITYFVGKWVCNSVSRGKSMFAAVDSLSNSLLQTAVEWTSFLKTVVEWTSFLKTAVELTSFLKTAVERTSFLKTGGQ